LCEGLAEAGVAVQDRHRAGADGIRDRALGPGEDDRVNAGDRGSPSLSRVELISGD
jgi:hypothetical protein